MYAVDLLIDKGPILWKNELFLRMRIQVLEGIVSGSILNRPIGSRISGLCFTGMIFLMTANCKWLQPAEVHDFTLPGIP